MNQTAYLYGQILGTHSFWLKDGFLKPDEYSEISEKYFLPGGETGAAATVLASLEVQVKMDGTHIGTEVAGMLKQFYADKTVDLSSLTYVTDYEGLMDYVVVADMVRSPMGFFQQLYASGTKRWNGPREDRFEKIRTEDILGDIREQTLGLAEVFDLKINWEEQYTSETVSIVYDQVVRAVMNIIKNASEHTPKGQTINIYIKEQNGELKFTVEDTGCGFTKEALLHGTEQFFMDDTSRSGRAHYGIGLFSAKSIAGKHGGRILLANSEETGGGKVEICFNMK